MDHKLRRRNLDENARRHVMCRPSEIGPFERVLVDAMWLEMRSRISPSSLWRGNDHGVFSYSSQPTCDQPLDCGSGGVQIYTVISNPHRHCTGNRLSQPQDISGFLQNWVWILPRLTKYVPCWIGNSPIKPQVEFTVALLCILAYPENRAQMDSTLFFIDGSAGGCSYGTLGMDVMKQSNRTTIDFESMTLAMRS